MSSLRRIDLQFGTTISGSLVWLSLLVYLLAGCGSAFGAVWCLSEGEDCRLEPVSSSCCQADSQGASQLAESPVGEQSCGSCTDIVLSRTVIKSRIRPLRGPLGQDAHLEPALPTPYSSGEFKRPILSRLTATPPSLVLAQLRTVVLLH